MIELIKELRESGLLMRCVRHGLISTKFIGWIEIYQKYRAECAAGVSNSQAAFNVAQQAGVSERTVYNVIAVMESE